MSAPLWEPGARRFSAARPAGARAFGLRPGDLVAGTLPNLPELRR